MFNWRYLLGWMELLMPELARNKKVIASFKLKYSHPGEFSTKQTDTFPRLGLVY